MTRDDGLKQIDAAVCGSVPAMMKFTLSRDDFEILLIMAGYATGSALRNEDTKLAAKFVRIMNEINKDNPNYKPYVIPDDWVKGTEQPQKK